MGIQSQITCSKALLQPSCLWSGLHSWKHLQGRWGKWPLENSKKLGCRGKVFGKPRDYHGYSVNAAQFLPTGFNPSSFNQTWIQMKFSWTLRRKYIAKNLFSSYQGSSSKLHFWWANRADNLSWNFSIKWRIQSQINCSKALLQPSCAGNCRRTWTPLQGRWGGWLVQKVKNLGCIASGFIAIKRLSRWDRKSPRNAPNIP